MQTSGAGYIWDENYKLALTIAPEDIVTAGPCRAFSLPVDDHAAKWIVNRIANHDVEDIPATYMTIDEDRGRWSGRIVTVSIERPDGEHTIASTEWWPVPQFDTENR